MNSTSPFLNVNSTNLSPNTTTLNFSYKNDIGHQQFSNSTTRKTRESFEKRFFSTRVREPKSSYVKIAGSDGHKNNSTRSNPNGFENLMNRVDIDKSDDTTDAREPSLSNDPQSGDISIPLKGLRKDDFYPKFVTDAKKAVDQILANSIVQEKDWEALAKIFQAINKYQYTKYSESKNVELMKDSLENFAQVLSKTSITTKAQFLALKNWASIASFDSSNAIGFNNLNQAKIYLLKLGEVMSSSNEEIQNLVHTYANVLFRYQFMEKCLDNRCIVKQELFTVIEKTFNLCEKFKEQSQYYFIRNALMSFERILQTTEKATFKNEIIDKLEVGFGNLLHKLTSEESTIVKQLSYLTIKSARGDPTLSKFHQRTTVKDIYPYQTEISIENMKANITFSLNEGDPLMQQLPKNLQGTYSHFIEKFGKVLKVKAQEIFKCKLYIAKDKNWYEIFNYILLGKSTGNGGVTECFWDENLCIPSAAMYVKDGTIWNLEHEFNHVLLHLHAGLKVNHPMDKFGKFGRLDWLNEGLSYVLIPNSFMEGRTRESLKEKGLPLIKDIIEVEATSQDYARSYSLVDYLLNKQKPILDRILVYIKNEEDDSLKKELENLKSLDSDFHAYLMTRWKLPGILQKSTTESHSPTAMGEQSTKPRHPLDRNTQGSTTFGFTISNPEAEWSEEEKDAKAKMVACKSAMGNAAVKTVTYVSAAPISVGTIALAILYFSGILSKQQGGNGRRGHSRRGTNWIRNNEPAKYSETKPLKQRNEFPLKDSNPSQRRQGNTRV